MKTNLTTKRTIGLVFIGTIIGTTIGHIRAYDSRKTYLINEAIKGRGIEALSLIENKEEEKQKIYKSTIDKVLNSSYNTFIAPGIRLAEKRFKEGKFDEIIEKYKTQ